jgi:hypothetical protein
MRLLFLLTYSSTPAFLYFFSTTTSDKSGHQFDRNGRPQIYVAHRLRHACRSLSAQCDESKAMRKKQPEQYTMATGFVTILGPLDPLRIHLRLISTWR